MLPSWITEKLSRRIVFSTLFVLTIVLAGAQIYWISQEEARDVEAWNKYTQDFVFHAAHTVKRPLEVGDWNELDEVVQRLVVEIEDVTIIEVTLPDGFVVSRYPATAAGDPRLRSGYFELSRKIPRPVEKAAEDEEEPLDDPQPDVAEQDYPEDDRHVSTHPTLLGKIAVGFTTEAMSAVTLARSLRGIVVGACALGIMGVFLVIILKRRLDEPLEQLEQQAVSLVRGQYDESIEFAGDDEIAQLAASIDRVRRNVQELTESVQQGAEATKQVAAMKDECLASMAAELRDPVETLVETVRELRHESDAAKLERLEGTALGLHRRLTQVLAFLRQEGAETTLRRERIDLSERVRRHVGQFAYDAKTKAVRIVPETQANATIHTDPDLLDQVVANLLDNALKLTKDGQITVTSRVLDPTCVLLSVEDTGEGIPAEAQPHVFDRMQSGFRADQREHQGSWIGLSIAKRSVDALGGVLKLDSTPGYGCTITVLLPRDSRVSTAELEEKLRSCVTEQIQLD